MGELTNFVTDIANSIRKKKRTTAPIKARDFPAEIESIQTDGMSDRVTDGMGWYRPLDRPDKPTMQDNTILMLFGVGKNSPNDIGFLIVCPGNYKVDWGNGDITIHTTNTIAYYMYDYDSVDAPANIQGYKFIWITITPYLTGNITTINLDRTHIDRVGNYQTVQVFELYIQCPLLRIFNMGTSSATPKYRLCNIFSLDINDIIGIQSGVCYEWSNLKIIEKLYLVKATSITYFLQGCYSYNQKLTTDIIYDNSLFDKLTSSAFYNSFYNQPFPQDVTFKMASSQFFYGNSVYNHTLTVDLAGRTANISATFIGTGCYGLKGLRLLNMGLVHTSLTISNSSLDREALIALGSDLPDRTETTPLTWTITNCFGAAHFTPEDRYNVLIKNITIVG